MLMSRLAKAQTSAKIKMMKKFQESETIEFKKSLSEKEEAGQSLCAFANKQGGCIYVGIENNGKVVGLKSVTEKTILEIAQYMSENIEPKLYPIITAETIDDHEIIKIEVSRNPQSYYTFKKIPYIRVGSSTRQMSQDEYQRRLMYYKSTNKDYSSTVVPETSVIDLSKDAIATLRKLLKESGRYKVDIDKLSDSQLLKDLLLLREDQLTIAALVLLGTEESVSKNLPYSEVRYGYKTSESEIHNQDMEIFRGGYLLYYQKIWEKINSRNITVSIPYKMRLIDKKAFDEVTIREAVNNAIVHRDYMLSGSSFLIQYPTKIIVKNPGGLPDGVTPENIIFESKPRNKLIADILFKCELVEQFGNGVNLMFKNQLSLGKFPPNYSRSDENHVELILDGAIQDVEFAKYVLKVAEEKQKELSDEELIILNKINRNEKVDGEYITSKLKDLGLIEQVSYGKYILSKQYYEDTRQKWEYTKRKGLSKNKNKELIIQHLTDFKSAKKHDILQLFDFSLTTRQIDHLIEELKGEQKIYFDGKPRSKAGSWRLVKKEA